MREEAAAAIRSLIEEVRLVPVDGKLEIELAGALAGNPAGRPRGARNRATVAAEALLEGEADALTRKAIDLALAGDTTALRLCMERLLPPVKDRPVFFALPPQDGAGNAQSALGALLVALANGDVTPSKATAIAELIEACRRAGQPSHAVSAAARTIHIQCVAPAGSEI